MPRQTKCGFKEPKAKKNPLSNITRDVAKAFKANQARLGIHDDPQKSAWFSRRKQKAISDKATRSGISEGRTQPNIPPGETSR